MMHPYIMGLSAERIGVSNHNLRQLKRAEEILTSNGIRISAVQNHFSLLHRDSEKKGLLSYCKENNIAFFSYMVLEQGALSGKYDENHPFPSGSGRDLFYGSSLMEIGKLTSQMKEIGKAHSADAAMIAIAWAMAKGTIPLVGVTQEKQVDEASETLRIKLSESEIQALDDASSLIKLDTTREWEECMKENWDESIDDKRKYEERWLCVQGTFRNCENT